MPHQPPASAAHSAALEAEGARRRYNSASMAARRDRVLKVARTLILASGLAFNIRELADKAAVGAGTIYYLFGSKEELIAHVLGDFIHERTGPEGDLPAYDFTSVSGMLDALERGVSNSMRHTFNLVRAVDSLFYAEGTALEIRRLIRAARMEKFNVLMRSLNAVGQLSPWVNVDVAAEDLSIQDGAMIHEWCVGNLADELFVQRRLHAFARFMTSVTQGPSHAASLEAVQALAAGLPEGHRPPTSP